MLKTALRPKWIAALLFAFLLCGVFVALSKWQFDRAAESKKPANPESEVVKALTDVFQPHTEMLQSQADQRVKTQGTFEQEKVVIPDRLNNGKRGVWLVQEFKVEATQAVIPVARGWYENTQQALAQGTPPGVTTIQGRLLPPESDVESTLKLPELKNLSTAQLANLWGTENIYAGFIAEDTLNTQSQAVGETSWLNVFYAIEWVFFAGCAIFLWFRLVRDEYEKEQEDLLLDTLEHDEH
ncbi:MAG: SURF1 family protein [Micrococcaceae bacterium]